MLQIIFKFYGSLSFQISAGEVQRLLHDTSECSFPLNLIGQGIIYN